MTSVEQQPEVTTDEQPPVDQKEATTTTEEQTEQAEPVAVTRVHVTNLPWKYTKEQLSELFSKSGKVVSASIVTRSTGESKGFGFIEYETVKGSAKAVEELNNFQVDNRRIGVVYSTSQGPYKPTAPKDYEDGEASQRLHVRNLQFGVKRADLEKEFSKYGKVKNCQLVKHKKTGKSRGYGFVVFEEMEDAKKAKEALNGSTLAEKEIVVLYSKSSGPRKTTKRKRAKNKKKTDTKKKAAQEKDSEEQQPQKSKKKRNKKRKAKNPNKNNGGEEESKVVDSNKDDEEQKPRRRRKRLFVKNLKEDTTEEQLTETFEKIGKVNNVVVPKDKDGNARGFAYIQMEDADEAEKAKEELHDCSINDSQVEVYWSQPRNRRKKPRGTGRGQNNNN